MAKKKKTLKVLKQEDARPHKRIEHLDSGGMGKKRNLSDRFCIRPWSWMEIGDKGRVNVCCPSWLPAAIGNLSNQSFEEVWNSDKAEEVRKSILDGSFSHCIHEACPHIQADTLPFVDDILKHEDPTKVRNNRMLINLAGDYEAAREMLRTKSPTAGVTLPVFYNLCYDPSCNLRCPSCRTNFINFSDEETQEFKKRKKIQESLLEAILSSPSDRAMKLNITGSGDPFGSKLFRELLEGIDGKDFPNLQITLQTNGVLFTKNTWEKMSRLHNNIMHAIISFDAATEETYKYTRNGGNWKKLLENMYFICKLRAESRLRSVRVDFVVQERNYQEMGDFVELITTEYPEVDSIYFSLITDWGTYPAEEFKKHAIWKKEHPDFDKFVKMLKEDARISHPKVVLGNLSEYKK